MTAGTAYGLVVVVGAGSVATVAVAPAPAVPRSPPAVEQAADAVSARAASTAGSAVRLATGGQHVMPFHSAARGEHVFVYTGGHGVDEPAGAVGGAGAAAVRAAVQRRRRGQPCVVEPAGRVPAPDVPRRSTNTVPYAELHCHSNFSFLDGASHPEELVEEAARLGLTALAITDHDGFYGIVRFAEAATALHVPTVFGAELTLDLPRKSQAGAPDPAGRHLVVLARDPIGYAHLARTITDAHMSAGEKSLPKTDLATLARQATTATGRSSPAAGRARSPPPSSTAARPPPPASCTSLVDAFGRDNVAVELWDHGDPARLRPQRRPGRPRRAGRMSTSSPPTTSTTRPPPRRPLATAMAAVRARRSLDELDGWLPPAATAQLRSGAEQARRFARYPGAVQRAADIGQQCAFDLQLVAPNLPDYPVPPGHTEMTWLRELTEQRRGAPVPEQPKAQKQIEHELAMIESLGFPGYFLIVWDIVEFCRRNDIFCQGRGSAANSAVCYALGITNADAVGLKLLFERFLSPERDGPPDIDLDIENGRREEAIQYVYERYGRENAAQVANVITYRPKSAVRDMGKALGHPQGALDAWSKQTDGYRLSDTKDHDIPSAVIDLAEQIQGFPRHLGIHSGGMVICDRPIVEVCPVEWGRMENRSVLQWDKDDCAAVGLVKIDLLGLGMLTALHLGVDLIRDAPRHGRRPGHDPPGARGLRHAVQGRLDRRVPGREPGPDGHPAQAQAPALLRPGGGGRPHPPRADPGRFGAPVHQAEERPGAGHLPPPAAGEVAGQDPRRAPLPGAAHADGHRRRRLHRRRGRPAAAGHGVETKHRAHGGAQRPALRGHGRQRHHRRDRRRHLRQARRLRQLRLPREPLGELRLPRLLVVVDEAPLPGRLLRRPAQRPAHGLLLAQHPGGRRPPARRHRPRARRQPERREGHPRRPAG